MCASPLASSNQQPTSWPRVVRDFFRKCVSYFTLRSGAVADSNRGRVGREMVSAPRFSCPEGRQDHLAALSAWAARFVVHSITTCRCSCFTLTL